MCTVPLPPGVYPIAVDKYIKGYYGFITNLDPGGGRFCNP